MRNNRQIIIWAVLCSLMLLTTDSLAKFEFDFDADREDYLSHMFIFPTGRIIPSGMLGFAFGGAFATQGGAEYLGMFSVGLGNVAELEVSTTHIVTNIFRSSEWMGTTALRFAVYESKPGSQIPTVTLALRSNRWSNFSGSGDELVGVASSPDNSSITEVNFETHLTSLYLSMTSELSELVTLHGGLVWHDVRTRDIYYSSYQDTVPTSNEPEDLKEAIVSVFGGIEYKMNQNTFSMFEFGAMPKIDFNQNMQEIQAVQLWQMMAGVRFFLSRVSAVDAGIRYRSDYSGLAEAEIRAGLNVGIDIFEQISKSVK